MVIFNQRKMCKHNISVKLRSGASVINATPVINYDSRYIVIACGPNVKVFSILSGECIQTLKYHTRPVISVRESKKNNLQLFTCSEDGIVVRWDYIDGKILQVYNLKMTVTSFYVPTASGSWFVSKPFQDQHRLYSLVPNEKIQVQLILKSVQPKENSISFGFMGKFCASIFQNVLSIYKFETKSKIRHMTGERNLTCVVCHPTDFIVATGDDHGRVILWTNALNSNQPIKSIYHWHTLPVSDLAFSFEGTHLHSGGGEAALVKWNLFSEEKLILPRMGSPIVHVCSSKDYVVTTHSDNVLQVVNTQRNVIQVIQGLTRSNPQNDTLLPAGLMYDPYLKTIVMNGKPGHLQFYDIGQDKLLFNLDIAGKNYISQERDTTVFNMDVQKAAVDESGLWLATAEYWSNDDTSPQIWLKFWMFDLQKQTFVLNTNVILPHNKELNCILFRPQVKELKASPLAVTTSSDGRFKIWTHGDNSPDGKQSWGCDSMGCYRDLPAGSACFSEEGSLLAVAFESVATLWTVKGTALKAVLCNEKHKRNIKQLVFGRHSCCSFLVCQDGVSITAWNVLTLSITWIVHTEVSVLAGDVSSSNIAAFCRDQSLIIFNPDDPKPLHSFENVSETPVLSAIFVPSTHSLEEEAVCFHDNSQLHFINETQNLFTVSEFEPEEEIESEKRNIAPKVVETPFGMLQAAQKVSNVKKIEEKQLSISNSNLREKDNIISNPILQNPMALCSMILTSLLIPAKTKSCAR